MTSTSLLTAALGGSCYDRRKAQYFLVFSFYRYTALKSQHLNMCMKNTAVRENISVHEKHC